MTDAQRSDTVTQRDVRDIKFFTVHALNQIVGVEVSVQDGGTYNITMANGYSLVQGSTARQPIIINMALAGGVELGETADIGSNIL
ncbi:hypothetical protein O5264_28335, partial [Escherichia coli]|nr:hypothetical protein [Escherichia coli]